MEEGPAAEPQFGRVRDKRQRHDARYLMPNLDKENELNEIIIKKYLARIDVTFISNKGLEDFLSKKIEKKEEPSEKAGEKPGNKGLKEKEKVVEEVKAEENAGQA